MRRAIRGALSVAVSAALLAGGPTVAALGAAPAGLSISIHNDTGSVRTGDHLSYAATLRNDGTAAVDGRLVVTVPAYMRITAANGADLEGTDASWSVEVPAGASVTKNVSASLGDIPKGELRVTTLVSLYLGDATQPAIRSAEADTIAGITDPAHAEGDKAVDSSRPLPSVLVWIGIGVVAILVAVAALGGWWFARRRPMRTPEPRPPL